MQGYLILAIGLRPEEATMGPMQLHHLSGLLCTFRLSRLGWVGYWGAAGRLFGEIFQLVIEFFQLLDGNVELIKGCILFLSHVIHCRLSSLVVARGIGGWALCGTCIQINHHMGLNVYSVGVHIALWKVLGFVVYIVEYWFLSRLFFAFASILKWLKFSNHW